MHLTSLPAHVLCVHLSEHHRALCFFMFQSLEHARCFLTVAGQAVLKRATQEPDLCCIIINIMGTTSMMPTGSTLPDRHADFLVRLVSNPQSHHHKVRILAIIRVEAVPEATLDMLGNAVQIGLFMRDIGLQELALAA
jgi:hypothetical protein